MSPCQKRNQTIDQHMSCSCSLTLRSASLAEPLWRVNQLQHQRYQLKRCPCIHRQPCLRSVSSFHIQPSKSLHLSVSYSNSQTPVSVQDTRNTNRNASLSPRNGHSNIPFAYSSASFLHCCCSQWYRPFYLSQLNRLKMP